jgi:hypothetical protein
VSGAVAAKHTHGGRREVYEDPRIPNKFVPFIAVHERAEANAMARGMSYPDAHEKVAVPAERRAVKKAGMSWAKYTEQVAGYLSHIEHEHVCKAPRDTHVNPKVAIEKPAKRGRGRA